MKINIPKVNFKENLLPAAIIVAGVLIGGAYIFINYWQPETLSAQAAADKAMAFINQNIEQGVTANLVAVTPQGSVYQISLKINETQYESYITKDGNFLFPTGISLKEPAKEAAQAENSNQVASEVFAKCLTEKGAKLYGAWWCPNCQNQNAKFGDSFQYLNYIECEKEPGKSRGDMVDACKTANIVSFPTWDFADGTRKTGDLSLETISELSGCSLQ